MPLQQESPAGVGGAFEHHAGQLDGSKFTPEFDVAQLEPPEKSEVGEPTCPTHDATGRKKTPQQTKGFASDTAEKTGISKRSINRSLSRADAIPSDIRDTIKGTHLDTGVYLDSLKGMEPEEQRAKVTADEGV